MEAQLSNHKELLRYIYVTQKQTLKAVMRHMETEYQLRAPQSVYLRLFGEWGIRKNKKGQNWAYVDHRIRKREKHGKRTLVYVDGIPQPHEKVQKEIARHVTTLEQSQYATAPSPKTPEGWAVVTPAAASTPGATSMPGTPLMPAAPLVQQKPLTDAVGGQQILKLFKDWRLSIAFWTPESVILNSGLLESVHKSLSYELGKFTMCPAPSAIIVAALGCWNSTSRALLDGLGLKAVPRINVVANSNDHWLVELLFDRGDTGNVRDRTYEIAWAKGWNENSFVEATDAVARHKMELVNMYVGTGGTELYLVPAYETLEVVLMKWT